MHLLLQEQHLGVPSGRLLPERLQPVSATTSAGPPRLVAPSAPQEPVAGLPLLPTHTLPRWLTSPALGTMSGLGHFLSAPTGSRPLLTVYPWPVAEGLGVG